MLLAQVNIALFRWPLTDRRMMAFTEQIAPINNIAESCDGFVWRFTDSYEPRGSEEPWCHPRLFFNLSVWRDLESLQSFINLATHRRIMQEGPRWLEPVPGPSLAMWWIPEDTRPSVEDAIRSIGSVAQAGDTQDAFTWKNPFPPSADSLGD